MTNPFSYQSGWLHGEGVNINQLVQKVRTPFYLYSTKKIQSQFAHLQQSMGDMNVTIHYAMKANSNLAILRLLHKLGAGFDVVSGGEYQRAVHIGAEGSSIIFSGVGKTKEEIAISLKGNIKKFNVESFPELITLNEVAKELKIIAPVSLRINPDIDANTHEKISTGRSGDKFGIPIQQASEFFETSATLDWVQARGVDIHIGSQITSLNPYVKAFEKVSSLVRSLKGMGYKIDSVDLGGGVGIPYHLENDQTIAIEDYCQLIRERIHPLGCDIEIEPGRFLVAEAGILVSQVIFKKETDRKFLIIDAAMNDLIRPTLYAAYHPIIPIEESLNSQSPEPFDVVGPVCETGDTFTKDRELPPMQKGDNLAIMNAGAYGAVMSSEYNTRPLVSEILVNGSNWSLIRERPSFDEMINREAIPDWL